MLEKIKLTGHLCIGAVVVTVSQCLVVENAFAAMKFTLYIKKIQESEKDIPYITLHDGFVPVCLNVWVLQTAYFQYRQQYGNTAPSQTNQ